MTGNGCEKTIMKQIIFHYLPLNRISQGVGSYSEASMRNFLMIKQTCQHANQIYIVTM